MTNLFTITDPGKDTDDEIALGLASHFHKTGLLCLDGVVANLEPASQRAALACGLLESLGCPDIPVGVGTDCNVRAYTPEPYEFLDAPSHRGLLGSGRQFLQNAFWYGKPKSITLLLISGLTDAAKLVREWENTFKRNINEVVLMGGVQQGVGGNIILDKNGFLLPDSANNQTVDFPAAYELFVRLQILGVPMTILTREAAYAVPIPREVYDSLGDHPAARRIAAVQQERMQSLWVAANLPPGHPNKGTLPDRCTRQWFLETFCGSTETGIDGTGRVWPEVKHIMWYDPLALVVSVPEFRREFFLPEQVVVRGTTHSIIGLSRVQSGILNPDTLRTFLVQETQKAFSS